MFPTFRLGPWVFQTYSSAYAAGLILAGMLAFIRLRRLPEPPARHMRVVLSAIAGGPVGTYLSGIFPTLQRFIQTGELAWIPRASFIGTLAGGALAVIIQFYRDPVSLGWRLDRGGQPWPLLLAVGRIGCLGIGCCGGRPTASALALWLPDEAGRWAMRYPTQIMSGVANLLIYGVLLAVERYGQKRAGKEGTWPFNGFLFTLYVGLFCLERFSMEWLRADAAPLLGPLSWAHLVTLAGMGAALVVIARGLRRARRSQRSQRSVTPQHAAPSLPGLLPR
jgi:phosphatidylglycerol---prolipoprotein diacylglyceryl transferase